MMARFVLGLAILAACALTPAQSAPSGQPPETAAEKQKEANKDLIPTDGGHAAARERDEARQELWDQKMKALTKGICTGC
jgi:flagellar motor protein MotB